MHVAAIERCLSLMEVLASEPAGVPLSDLAERLDLPKSAVHRMLATLVARGYCRQDPVSQAYTLSHRLAVLGFRYLDTGGLPDVAQTVLDRLARDTGEYCRLAIVEGEGLVWVARAQGATRGLRYDPDMSQEVVLHATATGKAWLATLPEEEALRLVCARGFRPPPHAGRRVARSIDELRAQLAETRRRGYAVAVEEGEAGTAALAVAVRAWDAPDAPAVGTLSVAGPIMRFGPERRAQLARPLADAGRELSDLWPLRQRQEARLGDGAGDPIPEAERGGAASGDARP